MEIIIKIKSATFHNDECIERRKFWIYHKRKKINKDNYFCGYCLALFEKHTWEWCSTCQSRSIAKWESILLFFLFWVNPMSRNKTLFSLNTLFNIIEKNKYATRLKGSVTHWVNHHHNTRNIVAYSFDYRFLYKIYKTLR